MNSIDEQLDMMSSMGIRGDLLKAFEKAAIFHGHICPGLAIGAAASLSFLEGKERSSDEELLAIIENDACGIDAIQSLLGCTFGKGNLIFLDHGKSVYTFMDRSSGIGIRYSLKELPPADEEAMTLFSKVRSGEADEEEDRSFRRLWVQRAAEVLKAGDDLFEKRKVRKELPEKARIFDSFICQGCGERTGSHRSVDIEGELYCIPCSELVRGG